MEAIRGVRSMKWRRGYLVGIAFLLVAMNLRPAVTSVPPLLDDLGITHAAASVLVTIPLIMFGLGALAGPWLRARLGEEQALIVILIVLGFGLLTRAIWPDAALFPATIIVCAAIAVMNVLLPSFVRRRFPMAVALMTALYTTVLSVGGAAGAAISVPLFEATDSIGIALGIWIIPVVIGLVAWLPQLKHGHTVRGEVPPAHLWGDRLAWAVTLMFCFQAMIFYALMSWLPTIYQDQGLSAETGGYLLAAFNLIGILGTLVGPAVSSRFPDERAAITMAVGATAIGILGIILVPTTMPFLWVSIAGIGGGASLAMSLIVMVKRTPDGGTAARLSSMAQGVGYLMGALGPLVIGLVHDAVGNWELPLVIVLCLCTGQLLAGRIAGRDEHVRGGVTGSA